MKAVWNGSTLAESDQTINVAGVRYFPPESVERTHFQGSETHTTCHIKGIANYYDLAIDGEVIRDGAWYYPEPSDNFSRIKDHVAFYTNRDVEVTV